MSKQIMFHESGHYLLQTEYLYHFEEKAQPIYHLQETLYILNKVKLEKRNREMKKNNSLYIDNVMFSLILLFPR